VQREVSCNYEDEEDEKTAVLRDTMSLDLTGYAEGRLTFDHNAAAREAQVMGDGHSVHRQRAGTAVTSACYSDNDDEKQDVVLLGHSSNAITDAGVVATTEYLQDLEVQRMPPVPAREITHSQSMERRTSSKKNSLKRKSARKHALTQDTLTNRSSSLSARSVRKKMSLNDVGALSIEGEINRAFEDSVKRITLRDLQINDEEEDVESLFDDDARTKMGAMARPNGGSRHSVQHRAPHHGRHQTVPLEAAPSSLDDFYVNHGQNAVHHPNHHGVHGVARQHLSPQQLREPLMMRNNSSPMVTRSASPHRHCHYNSNPVAMETVIVRSQSNNAAITRSRSNNAVPPMKYESSSPQSKATADLPIERSPTSFSQQTMAMSQKTVGILLPSEQRRGNRKRKKTSHILRKSVGAFLNAFGAKTGGKYSPTDLAKEREEFRANHPEDIEEYYVYYGDPQQQQGQEEVATMTKNALISIQNGHRASPSENVLSALSPRSPTLPQRRHGLEVFFEDETCVVVAAEGNVTSIELIRGALGQRGWSPTMSRLFALCIKNGDQCSDSERVVTLEDAANPIAAMASYANGLNLTSPKLVVCYKQTTH